MTTHTEPHPLAGQIITLNITERASDPNSQIVTGAQFIIEDWADRVFGQSWGDMGGNPTAIKYAMRSGFGHIDPTGEQLDEVVYGKIIATGLSNLIHTTEIPT